MGKFVKVATTDELAEQPVKCVEIDGKKIALFDVQGEIFALSDTCTHRGGTSGQADMDDVNQEAFATIVRLNAEKPEVFQRGKDLVRVRADADQLLSIEAFTERSLKGYLAKKILWIGTRRFREGAIHPPNVVVSNILSRPSWSGIPALRVLTQAPVFSRQGTLITEPGYHPYARLSYAPHLARELVRPE